VFFGTLKKLQATAVGKFDDGSVNAQITRLVQAYQSIATSFTIWGSFRKIEMDLAVTTQPFRIRIIEQTLRETPGFKEVWDRYVSLEDLSRRRQLQRCGIINSEFLPV
jgi:tRNA G37 N-methylase Trm5